MIHKLNEYDEIEYHNDGSCTLWLDFVGYDCANSQELIALLMFPVYGSFPEVLS